MVATAVKAKSIVGLKGQEFETLSSPFLFLYD